MIAPFKFLLFCIAIAIVYGICHDQVTARVCVEYFTIGHPNIFGTESPTLLAIGWGIMATWWGGLIIGGLLIASSLIGPWPHYRIEGLYRPVILIMLIVAPIALVAGLVGYFMAHGKGVVLGGTFATKIPVDRQDRFVADAWAHSASYLTAFAGGIFLAVRVMLARVKSARARAWQRRLEEE